MLGRVKRDFVRGLGADQVAGYDEIAAGCGEPVDVILDGVGGDVLAGCLQALAPRGRLVTYNGTGGRVDANELRMRSTAVIGFTVAQLAG
jgi:NADPH:quinone reductase